MAKKAQILFIESSPTDAFSKIARALKKTNYETVLLSLLPINDKFAKESYSRFISFDFKFFKARFSQLPNILFYSFKKIANLFKIAIKVHKFNPETIIIRTPPNWMSYLFSHYFRKSVYIHFPYDFRSFGYPDRKSALKTTSEFELNAEKWCFENADGIIYKGVKNKLELINKNVLGNVKIIAPSLNVLPFCSDDLILPINKDKLSKKDKEIHLVFVGHIGAEESWKKSVEMVVNNKIHLHLYGKTVWLTAKQSENRESYKEFSKNPYFHIHPQLSQEELVKEISKYDYGIWLGYYNQFTHSITSDTGNKFATYFEAGLPVIYFNNHKYIGESLKQHGAAIGIDITSPLGEILKKISKKEYENMVKKIDSGRKKITAEKAVPVLEDFISKAKQHKIAKCQKS